MAVRTAAVLFIDCHKMDLNLKICGKSILTVDWIDKGRVAFEGASIMGPNEENVLFHLDGAYGKNWYQTSFVPNVGPLHISDRGHIPYKGDKLS